MTAAAISVADNPGRLRSRPLVAFVGLVTVFSLILGTRYAISAHLISNPFDPAASSPAAKGPAVLPTSAAIEGKWGVRFTAVLLLADGGLVEMRYQVLDSSKVYRLHSGNMRDLPVIKVEGSGKVVSSQSLMFHAKHGDTNSPGRSYSILYANSNGAIRIHSKVSIQLADGLQLQHIPIQN